jgi:hypothetical protein
VAIYVLTITWSDKPIKVVGSYVILLSALFVRIKSMQDESSPRLNVLQAGGPGCNPFKIFHPYCSQMSMSQCARWLVCLSSLRLVVVPSSRSGARFAILVFQSPHITEVSCAGNPPTISSIWLLVTVSSIPLRCWLKMGGRYIFPIHIFSPPISYRHTLYVYSFPTYDITLIPARISIAIPPLRPVFLRSSKT